MTNRCITLVSPQKIKNMQIALPLLNYEYLTRAERLPGCTVLGHQSLAILRKYIGVEPANDFWQGTVHVLTHIDFESSLARLQQPGGWLDTYLSDECTKSGQARAQE